MADSAQLELVITSQTDRVLAGLSSFERSLGLLEKQHAATARAAEHQNSVLDDFTKKLGPLGFALDHVKELLAGWGLVEVGEKLFGLVENTVQWDESISKLTDVMNGDAAAASKWSAVLTVAGGDALVFERGVVKLAGEINKDSGVLKAMGIATEDAGGHLRSVNDVLLDAADYFHAHEGATANDTLATQLFGKSAVDLLPVLMQGRQAIQAVSDEASKMGLVLDNAAVQKNRQFAAELQLSQMAAHGLEVTIGNELLPGLAYLGHFFTVLIENNLPAFEAALANAVGYVIGFVEAITGVKAQISPAAAAIGSLAGAVTDYGNSVDTSNSASKDMAAAERAVREQAQATTQAIQAQIDALDDQNKATERQINDQVKTLELARQQEQFDRKIADLNQRKADDEKRIQKDKTDYLMALDSGNLGNLQQILNDSQTAKEDEAKADQDISRETADHNRQTQIDSLKAQLDAGKQAHDDKVKLLQDEEKAVQDAAQKQIEAMQDAASGSTAALANGLAAVPGLMSDAATSGMDVFRNITSSGAVASGTDMGNKVEEAFRNHDFGPLASTIGAQIGNSMESAAGHAFEVGLGQNFQDFLLGAIDLVEMKPLQDFAKNSFLHWLGVPGFAGGGNPPIGQDFWVGEQGPELMRLNPGGGATVTSHAQSVNSAGGMSIAGVERLLAEAVAELRMIRTAPAGDPYAALNRIDANRVIGIK